MSFFGFSHSWLLYVSPCVSHCSRYWLSHLRLRLLSVFMCQIHEYHNGADCFLRKLSLLSLSRNLPSPSLWNPKLRVCKILNKMPQVIFKICNCSKRISSKSYKYFSYMIIAVDSKAPILRHFRLNIIFWRNISSTVIRRLFPSPFIICSNIANTVMVTIKLNILFQPRKLMRYSVSLHIC
jgi:hypothetical protein